MGKIDTSSLENVSLSRKNSLSQIHHNGIGNDTCRVCGDGNAKTHYGVVTCFGCKGFFRRTLKRPNEYQCRHNGNCVVDRHERNSCRFCRFKKCLEVGMDPKAVRPDRDATGRHYQGRQRRSKMSTDDEVEVDAEWSRKLAVEMRTILMQLLNIDLIVGGGESSIEPTKMYPLPYTAIRQILDDPLLLEGKRTEMRYESLREVLQEELPAIAHRRLIAIIDWVDHLCDMMDIHGTDDKLLMVKAGFAPLMVFSLTANTARTTKRVNVLSLSTSGYIGRFTANTWDEPYHFANHLAEKCIDDLVEPLRKLHLKEEEMTLLKAIVILNPNLKQLSPETSDAIADLRDRIQETLYHVVRETHPKEVASSRFGNLLLLIPSVMMLGKLVMENLTFVDSFGNMTDRLLHDLLQETVIAEVEEKPMEVSSNGVSSQEELSPGLTRRHSEPRMIHSSSSSSIESLSSFPCTSTYQNDVNGMTYNLSCNSLPAQANDYGETLNGANSMPNIDMQECDPDYNVTITPDMYSDMRQAISAVNSTHDHAQMEEGVPENQATIRRRDSVPQSPSTQPFFYISTVESTKHKFTVTNFDRMNSYNSSPPQPPQSQTPATNGYTMPPQAAGMVQNQSYTNMQHMQQQQQPLVKTNSLPPQYMQQQVQNNYDLGYQQMDYEEANPYPEFN